MHDTFTVYNIAIPNRKGECLSGVKQTGEGPDKKSDSIFTFSFFFFTLFLFTSSYGTRPLPDSRKAVRQDGNPDRPRPRRYFPFATCRGLPYRFPLSQLHKKGRRMPPPQQDGITAAFFNALRIPVFLQPREASHLLFLLRPLLFPALQEPSVPALPGGRTAKFLPDDPAESAALPQAAY